MTRCLFGGVILAVAALSTASAAPGLSPVASAVSPVASGVSPVASGSSRKPHSSAPGDGSIPVASGFSRKPQLPATARSRAYSIRQSAQQSEGAAISVWSGVFTEEQARRGEAVYGTECANCHGPTLEGADMTPPLVGGLFTSNWNDLTVADLFERIRTTMPLDKPGKLSRQQHADVIAYVLKANGWPAGSTELSRELAALKQIRIEATRN